MAVGFTAAAALVNELMEARHERRLLRVQKQMAGVKLLIIDELGFVPLSKTGAELLFELISQRYERGATMITSNLPFDEWTETFGTERLTGALLDRLTHHVNIIESRSSRRHRFEPDGRRPELQACPEPRPKGRSPNLIIRHGIGPAGQCAMARASYLMSARAMAHSAQPLAWYCAATWPVFDPPLTGLLTSASYHAGFTR